LKKSIHSSALAGATMMALILSFAGAADAAVVAPPPSAIVWDEAINGPLGNFDNQTALGSLKPGDNEIRGVTGQTSPGVFDRDYFHFIVPAGLGLTAIIVIDATSAGPLGTSFIGIEAGPAITVAPVPTPPDASFLLGWRHYAPDDIGTDILGEIGNPMPAMGATGFTPPLGPGEYAIWVQETGMCTCRYDFDFVVAPIPEPASTAGLLAAGLALFVGSWRYRRPSPRLARGSLLDF
jgi:hypothetical protein